MLDEQSEQNQERGSQLAVAVGMLLFASVILGSGVLGDTGNDRLSDENERGEDADSNPATDREDDNDRLGNDWAEENLDEDMARLEIACDDGEGDIEACEEMRGMMLENRMMANGDDMRGMDERRGHDDRDIRGENQMRVPPEVLREMVHMWCHSHVFDTFWENTHAVELDDGSGFEMITYDDDGHEESTVISHDAMWQITSGLEPLVGSCAGMMMELMGVGMPPHDHEDEWDEDCEEDDREDWDEEESDESDEEEPREPRHADDEDDRRHGDWNPCADHDREHDWDDESDEQDEDSDESNENSDSTNDASNR